MSSTIHSERNVARELLIIDILADFALKLGHANEGGILLKLMQHSSSYAWNCKDVLVGSGIKLNRNKNRFQYLFGSFFTNLGSEYGMQFSK